MTRTGILAAAALAGLAACQAQGPAPTALVPGPQVLGVDDRASALAGAGIGLLSGNEVAGYLAAQEAQLTQNLSGTGAYVLNRGDRLVVILPGNVTFATDSARIQPGFQAALADIAATLRQYPESFIDLIGHTDSRGSVEYNQRLSEDRALSVADFFRNQGIFPGRIASYGVGEGEPIATNDTPDGRQANRRVEIVIFPAIA